MLDNVPHDDRTKIETMYAAFLTRHIGRAAMLLLCIATELQLYFRFDGAKINARIQEMWNVLMVGFEVKEIYEERYMRLMKERGIASTD